MKLQSAFFAVSMVGVTNAFVPHHERRAAAAFTTGGKQKTMTSLEMSASGPLSVRAVGIGHAVPPTVVTNKDLESVVETDDEWIRTRTGISQRHVLTGDETLRELGVKASKEALKMAGLEATDIDMVICASSSAEDMFGDATTIAAELGCTTDTFGWDLTAACSGFLFGTVTAGQFLSAPGTKLKNALVIGADALSRWVDWDDRNSCILFGDGAGAMIITNQGLESEDYHGLLGFAAHSNGHGYVDLNCPFKGDPRPISTPDGPTELSQGGYSGLKMNGQEVYKFATREVPQVLTEAIDSAGITVEDIDWLLLHQANIRIMEVVAKKMNIPMDKVITNLDKYGNTSAASIPIALSEAVHSGKVKKGDIIACSGFGAGLSWGAVILKWG